jgi:hypothetical protein
MNTYKAYVNCSTQSLPGNLKSGQNSPDSTAGLGRSERYGESELFKQTVTTYK